MKTVKLQNGNRINCISRIEAQMLENHINGYFDDKILIENNDVIFDVGANIGMFGIKLSEKYSSINIYAFEPIKDIYQILESNAVSSGNENFRAHQIGFSDKIENVSFNFYPNSPAMSSSNPEIWNSNKDLVVAVKGSLHNGPSKWWWAKFIPQFLYPLIIKVLKGKMKKVNCELNTISNFISNNSIGKINLLKIDCEGSELKVIEGIKESDWDKIEQLIIEVHDIDGRLEYMKNLLKSKGYKIFINREESLIETNLYNIFANRRH